MPKQPLPTDEGAYNPFDAISGSLSALKEKPQTPPAEPVKQAVEVPAAAPPKKKRRTVDRGPRTAPPAPPVEPQATAQPIESGGAVEAPARPQPATTELSIQKRFKVSREEASEFEMAAVRLGARLGVSVDFSKLTRALWSVYLRHEEDILRDAPEDETWERPPNNDAVGLAALDQKLAELVNAGLMMASQRPKNRQ